MIYFLDTNIWIFLLNEKYQHLNLRFENSEKNNLRMPSLVLYELYYGAEKSKNPKQNIYKIQTLISEIDIVPFDKQCARVAGNLKANLERTGQIIGNDDLLIAATALAHNGIIVTNNTREFSRVKGLKVEDWTIF